MENITQTGTINNFQNNTSNISEKNYPITKLWIFKSPIIFVLVNLVALLFGRYYPILVLLIPILLIANPLIRLNFHYLLDEKFLNVKQGVISKKQRNLPYGVIQNVFVKQDLFDRIFGLATLRVENAAQGGKSGSGGSKSFRLSGLKSDQDKDSVGSSGNKINIPGLKKKDAEELKNCLLQRIKENPIEDSQSGL
jgi:membrane protein YdbS with pleckstrin-like domain